MVKTSKKNALIVAGALALVVVALILSTRLGKPVSVEEATLKKMGYYSGPMRNRSGDLVDGASGKVLEKAKTPVRSNMPRD
jgi:hypothetical protein